MKISVISINIINSHNVFGNGTVIFKYDSFWRDMIMCQDFKNQKYFLLIKVS